jgi:hypothetical protein
MGIILPILPASIPQEDSVSTFSVIFIAVTNKTPRAVSAQINSLNLPTPIIPPENNEFSYLK